MDLRTQDTSDPRHFSTGADISAEVSYGHFRTKEDIAGFAAAGNTEPNLGKEGTAAL